MTVPACQTAVDASSLDCLRDLALRLSLAGQASDALLLLNHLDRLEPGDARTIRLLAQVLVADGQILAAIDRLGTLKAATADPEIFAEGVRRLTPVAIQAFNDRLAAADFEAAEKYAAALAALLPGSIQLLDWALVCNMALGRKSEAARYAAALLARDPSHAGAQAVLADSTAARPDADAETDRRFVESLSNARDLHPLLRLRDIHDLISDLLCRELTDRSIAMIDTLLRLSRGIDADLPEGSEWAGWAKHYRLALDAIDLDAALAPTPVQSGEQTMEFVSSNGQPMTWPEVQSAAGSLGARTVFFAAADASYVDLYARWYIASILKHCDVSSLVIVHVIGGAGRLREVAQSIGIASDRVIFAGDAFEAQNVTTKCYDTPPKGLIPRPVAHFQSVRFLALGTLLRKLRLPVFVSDIDLLLQRGVADLIERCAQADLMLNENAHSTSAGSRYTANLLLVNPTANADTFLRFLRWYLEQALARTEVSRWIDQFALMMARHHLWQRGTAPRIDYFDTNVDINNVMYRSYQNHPFRFLSLYHGFDMSSLGSEPATQAAA